MKNQILKLEIEIENEFKCGIRGKMEIVEMIFTDYSNLLDVETILENYNFALKKLKGFTMLTASLSIYEDGYYKNRDIEILSSFRYTNKYGEVKKSRLNGNSYNNFIDANLKSINLDIKEIVEIGNRKFIDILKKSAA